jgi:hypothetical protein
MKAFRFLPLLAAAGCVDQIADKADAQGTGAMLSVDYFGGSDVVGFHFTVERVACDASDAFSPFTVEATVDLVDGIFPGMIELIEQVYSAETRHLGADLFTALEPGCYDVTAAPASAIDGDDWTPSADCSVATAEGLAVVDGVTTEATLISQCVGDEVGALDTLVTLNHPPVVSVDYPTDDRNGDGVANGDDGKFNYECEPVEVCATIYDVDDDPIETDWAITPASGVYSVTEGPLTVIGFDDGHRIWEQCIEVVTRVTDTYDVDVTVWDLGYSGGGITRIEDLVAPEQSRDEMTSPIHTNWAEEPLCFDADGDLVPAAGVDIHREAGCAYIDAETYYCSGLYDVDDDIVDFLCDGTNLIEVNLYPNCDGSDTTPPPPAEVNCDGLDNDGDGTVDEGSSYGTRYSWTNTAAGGSGAGTIGATSATFNTLTDELSFSSTIAKASGITVNGFTFAINGGPNPKGQGDLALMYFDCNAGSPIINVVAYNGLNTLTSYYDGSSAWGTQAPDRIQSSQLDASFVNSASCSITSAGTTVAFSIDATAVRGHSPLYPASYGWTGMGFGTQLGIWYHPIGNGSFTYTTGWLTGLSAPHQSWLDLSYASTTNTAVCL